jgi:two-component system sensor histidine kinase/response regulator
MIFDIHTLAIVLSFLMIAQALALFAHFLMNKEHRGLIWWTIGSTALAFGFTFNFLRDAPGIGQFSILVNNLFFVFGFYFIYRGILWFLNKNEKATWYILFLVPFSFAIFYYTYIVNVLVVRTVIISFSVAFLSLLIAWRLFSNRNPATAPASLSLSFVFLILAVFFVLRIFTRRIEPIDKLFTPSIIQSATYLIVIVLSTLWTFGFIILFNLKLNAQIREDKENLDLIFNTSPNAVMLTRIDDGSIVSVNERFSLLTGYSEREAIGKTTIELMIWRNPDDRKQLLQPLSEKGFCENLEIVFQRKNKTIFTGLLSAKIIKLNNIEHIITVTRDVSDSKIVAEKLNIAKLRLENIIEGTNAGTWEWNVQTDETIFNEQWAEMLGYTLEELSPVTIKTWEIHTHPGDLRKSEKLLKRHFAGELPYYDCELRMKHKNGQWIWIHDRGRVITKTSEGEPLMMFGMHNLITERKDAEERIKIQNEELQKINAEKDKFFSIIAHDLKSPFNSILGFSDLLVEQMREKNYTGIDKYAELIQLSSTRVMDLLLNLMEWSRSQTGRMEFNPEYFELVVLIKDTDLLLSGAMEQKSISLSKSVPSNVSVYADKKMISTVLRNLISNAIKFTHPGGKITISVEERKAELRVSVSDNGVGIPKASIEKLFSIDESYSTVGTTNEKGTGLGLILCKDFVEKHGGKIWVESEEGKGSTFYFSIPNSIN